ncbi:class I SAM-dependent methyltransferase [Solirubrobacter sp. CPCC 204708]|uniref:Class I SAM-dependent methyltransferase n=1 Tax=Solirubrobacter deserti TaxID=2282478 RepID=A0ABT4RJM5_9ACTN|nr:class I SAM-dependent methyltransferase [Solirubrobacter deserti]MDA0138762.1 class I SAM-dependent methyltransferase [Solirubrobacter deserti]
MAARADRRGAAGHRRRLLAGLSGRVVEVGAGNGRNFVHYPPEVLEVVAIEPEPTLRALAEEAERAVPVRVRDGYADELPLADGEVDAAVVSLVLCSVPDQARALAEVRRVVRPGGQLRFYEHVVPPAQPKRALFGLADRTGLWPKVGAGCHLARDTAAAITAAGFAIERCERLEFRAAPLEPRLSYILGCAHR